MELVIAAVSVLMLLAVWRLMLRKTILDHHRDALFDLRDGLRDTFVKNNWDLGSPLYIRLRSLLNGYLRYTEDYSYMQFNYVENQLKNNPDMLAAMKARFDNSFVSTIEGQEQVIAELRRSGVKIMMSYMIMSSGPLVFLAAICFPIVAFCEAFRMINRGFWSGLRSIFRRLGSFETSARIIFEESVSQIAERLLVEDIVEEVSYQQGSSKFSMQSGVHAA